MRRSNYRCAEFYNKKCDGKCGLKTLKTFKPELRIYCPFDGKCVQFIRVQKHDLDLEAFDES